MQPIYIKRYKKNMETKRKPKKKENNVGQRQQNNT